MFLCVKGVVCASVVSTACIFINHDVVRTRAQASSEEGAQGGRDLCSAHGASLQQDTAALTHTYVPARVEQTAAFRLDQIRYLISRIHLNI